MIKLINLSLQRGAKRLFENANVTIHPGWRVGLTGANGTGKSSLFALIMDQIHADEGEVELPGNPVIAWVSQETPDSERSALEFALDGDAELREVEAAMTNASDTQLANLHARMDAIDGYTAPSRAARLLHGLGFRQDQLDQPVSTFSGGWRMRLNLAQALMCRSDILLLDEPTNHLDLESVIWLEQWLKRYTGTLLLISHDREFLDGVAQHIMHIEHGRIDLYTGNYTAFERQRAEKLAQQQAMYEAQQKEIAHLQRFVDRFRAKATKARQAQSRVKALERMEKISAAHVDAPFHFDFLVPEKSSDPLMALEQVAAGYGDISILADITTSLRPGMRLGLLGNNGAGKSTFIKLLAGKLEPLSGNITCGKGLKIGYFAQHQLEQLIPEQSALDHMLNSHGHLSEQQARDALGGFGFRGDRVTEPVAPFSGGEKSRLALALMIQRKPNLLLLDEPTNHLDLEMRHALSVALQGYEGALVLVSHDRHLLRICCDEFLLVKGGSVHHYDGDLDDYRNLLAEEDESENPADQTAPKAKPDRKQQRRLDAERRKRLQPLTSKIKKIEHAMQPLEKEKQRIENQLADAALYNTENREALKALLQQQGENRRKLEVLEMQWLALNEELEALSQSC